MFYPAQIATETHVFVRVNEQNTNIATSSLSTYKEDTKKETLSYLNAFFKINKR